MQLILHYSSLLVGFLFYLFIYLFLFTYLFIYVDSVGVVMTAGLNGELKEL